MGFREVRRYVMRNRRQAAIKSIATVALLLAAGLFSRALLAEENDSACKDPGLFRDPADCEFDVSAWLGSRYGFLPVPVIITGPTLGAGGGINFLFLKDKLTGRKLADGRHVPPNMMGVAAIATENGSRAAAAYHMGFWNEDRLRTTTFIGRPDLNLDFYPSLQGREFSVTMNLDGWAFYQETKLRLGNSNFLLGGNYTYATVNSSPVDYQGPLVNALLNQAYRMSGLAAVLEYDSRDTIFTPTRGAYGKLVAQTYAGWLGSDYDFTNYRGKLFEFLPLSRDFDLGLRVEGQTVSSDAPYFPTLRLKCAASPASVIRASMYSSPRRS